MENFNGPEGLYFEAHIFENTGANKIINKEFKTENHDAGISVSETELALSSKGT